MPSRPKVLILDDDQDFLDVCQQMLATLPSKPEILTATSGSRALGLLESDSFSLLLTDLRMPGMDGFQVLAIVRRRLPTQRIVVMTGAVDEQMRSRAYAMGIDLFVEKPRTQKETQLFFECIESMLEIQNRQGGFRGVVEHKALVDIVQMECLTRNSAVLKIASDRNIGYIWFLNGEIVDAATATSKAEAAFREIMSWNVGSFDLLPADPNRARSIQTPSQALLLDTAQALDEAAGELAAGSAAPSRLATLGRTRGVEFLLSQDNASGQVEQWSCDNADGVATWAQRLLEEYGALGKLLGLGTPERLTGYGPQRHITVVADAEKTSVVGLERTLKPGEVENTLNEILTQWDS